MEVKMNYPVGLVEDGWAVPQNLMKLVDKGEQAFLDDPEYLVKMCRSARGLRRKRETWAAKRLDQAESVPDGASMVG